MLKCVIRGGLPLAGIKGHVHCTEILGEAKEGLVVWNNFNYP